MGKKNVPVQNGKHPYFVCGFHSAIITKTP